MGVEIKDLYDNNLYDCGTPHLIEDKEQFKEYVNKAVKKWGIMSQVSMLMEELSELLVAMNHYNRGRVDKDKVVEELVDAYMMIEEWFILIDVPKDQIKDMMKKKLEKFYGHVDHKDITEDPQYNTDTIFGDRSDDQHDRT